jgi:uncharacterized protein
MSAQANKETAEAAYRAFADGDAAGAMQNMSDDVAWTVGGDNALTGTYKGKEEVAGLWVKLGEKGLKTEPHDFIADGAKVVVLTTVTLDGQTNEAADILTYNAEGKLVAFEQLGDPSLANSLFPR